MKINSRIRPVLYRPNISYLLDVAMQSKHLSSFYLQRNFTLVDETERQFKII